MDFYRAGMEYHILSLVEQYSQGRSQQVEAEDSLVYARYRLYYDIISGSNEESADILPTQDGFLGGETMRPIQIYCSRRKGSKAPLSHIYIRMAVAGDELWKP